LIAETYCFPDVLDEWFSAFVCAAKRLSWIQGYTDGKFYPARTISKAEAMAIIIQSLGVPLDSVAELPPGVREGEWYTPYIRKAMEMGLILEPAFDPQSAVMRADAAVWMYRSLKSTGG
jgi:pullulanase